MSVPRLPVPGTVPVFDSLPPLPPGGGVSLRRCEPAEPTVSDSDGRCDEPESVESTSLLPEPAAPAPRLPVLSVAHAGTASATEARPATRILVAVLCTRGARHAACQCRSEKGLA